LISHIKLFMDGGVRQVALFSGPDEHTQWVRNCPAEALLSHGWHLLPKEELITIQEVEVQGFLNPGALAEQSSEPEPGSDEQLKAFLAKVAADSALQARLQGALTVESLQTIASEAGFNVSPQQLNRSRKMGEDLITSGGGWLLWCMLANFLLNSSSNSLVLTLRK
jgi:predicted ribosomally synthesized peptide with nif11-like leader